MTAHQPVVTDVQNASSCEVAPGILRPIRPQQVTKKSELRQAVQIPPPRVFSDDAFSWHFFSVYPVQLRQRHALSNAVTFHN
jgi:hypothetical protein